MCVTSLQGEENRFVALRQHHALVGSAGLAGSPRLALVCLFYMLKSPAPPLVAISFGFNFKR